MGRDERFARARELRAQQSRIMQKQEQVAGAPTHAMDRFGVPIQRGDHVLYRPNIDLVFQVVDVKPPLDPRVPLGMVTVVLAAQTAVTVQGAAYQPNLVVVGVAESAPPASIRPGENTNETAGAATDPTNDDNGIVAGQERSQQEPPDAE